jgi:threonyl-tRNA synthetase
MSAPVETHDALYKIRHSLAHVLAQAVLTLRPGSTLGFGPPIDDGFYYDFIIKGEPLTDADFPEIEKRMNHVIKQNQAFSREDLSPDDAFDRIEKMGEPYKREYAADLVANKGVTGISFYTNGTFVDMCEGPHVENTNKIPKGCFKLRSIAGAYWRGNSKNAMMTRIYAWAYENKEALDAKVKAYKEAQERDHKKLGKELDIFVIDEEVGKGLPLWMPNGTVLRDELEKLAKELEFKDGYQRVATPHLSKAGLYYKTGHLPYYASHMYPLMELREEREGENGLVEEIKETYALRPMNCPHHHKIFAARPRSYRDLPLRLAEYGQVYRFEDSGALSGLLRVRGMCMNDAHIYCTEDQFEQEFMGVIDLYLKYFDIFGIDKYVMRLSMHHPKGLGKKYVDNSRLWLKTEDMVRNAMRNGNVPFVEVPDEAAFYGPKIDVEIFSAIGREFTLATNQVDFAVPPRFDLKYINNEGKEETPLCIHRAPLGTHERTIGFLIEHFAGNFPVWLAPQQVSVVPITTDHNGYADRVATQLKAAGVRAQADLGTDRMNAKIRAAQLMKIPYMLVVGDQEMQNETVSLRRRDGSRQNDLPVAEFLATIRERIQSRSKEL